MAPKIIDFQIQPLDSWLPVKNKCSLIAGPCSAETLDQVIEDAIAIDKIGKVSAYRSGVWKPRTRPNAFEGNGEQALKWLQEVKKVTSLKTTVEVANAEHAELALKYGVDILWIGARTTVNPFSVQEIADVLKGVNIPVMVKNPINPDLNLWIGALERIYQAGVTQLAAVHRGFNNYESTHFRNSPRWEIPIQLMSFIPNLPVICDPSHISGKRHLIQDVSQKAMDYGFHGLMIETHPDPENAWSDADQQITPNELNRIISEISYRNITSLNKDVIDKLTQLRRIVDSIDEELLQILAKRMKVIEEIGHYKEENNITIFQLERWAEILETRGDLGEKLHLNSEFINRVLSEIHKESIQVQTDIMNKNI